MFVLHVDLHGILALAGQWQRVLRGSSSSDVLLIPADSHLRLLPSHLEESLQKNAARRASPTGRCHGHDDPPLQSESYQNATRCRRLVRPLLASPLCPLHQGQVRRSIYRGRRSCCPRITPGSAVVRCLQLVRQSHSIRVLQ